MALITPLPLFDSIDRLAQQQYNTLGATYCLEDIQKATTFLIAYKGSLGTFNSYRREIERLLHWAALYGKKSLKALRREDLLEYVAFCQKPPQHWIGYSKPARFIEQEGTRIPNPEWRPFVVTVSKAARRKGAELDSKQFKLASGSLREVLAILSSFFSYLVQENYTDINPVALIRQKNQLVRSFQSSAKIRRLSELQWQYVIETARKLADSNGELHERTLFIMSALYSMYLRISELAASQRWMPKMNDFARDSDGNWWFTTVGKGNKERQIAVSEAMLEALKRWRKHLGLSTLPSAADYTPLLPRTKGQGPITSTNYIREIVQSCFDSAITQLQQDGFVEEAELLNEATVHWLRHTGISDDVKIRPREHVRDDAGHSSGAITDRYIDVELRERHLSARKKVIFEED
ncbi:MAG: site-specific recombinase, phage integrase family [Gammaproteobacteria bacterium]|jgi:site-specific recombinase XerD|nr:site-specific recombinase, phage integrase family [Gammaproteobacteria bacterium]